MLVCYFDQSRAILKTSAFPYFWLCWVFGAAHVCRLPAVGLLSGCGAHVSYPRLSSRARALGRRLQELGRSRACGIFPDLGSNQCPLLCQVDS